MGTRQLRLNDPAQIRSRITDSVGKEITIILSDSTTIFGTITSVNNDEVLLKNMRLKKVKCLFSAIVEAYLDTP